MKKYQLKYYNEYTKKSVIKIDTNKFENIMYEIRYIETDQYRLNTLSVWMDGKVLE